MLNIKGKRSVDSIHKELGHVMWDNVGMARTEESLKEALVRIKEIKKEFWSNVYIPGSSSDFNVELEKAIRLADFIEVGYLMALDGLNRNESCGGHFREEYHDRDRKSVV